MLALLWVRTLFRFYARVAKSNFPFVDCALAPLGLPLFVVLLYRSWFQHRILKRVSWKGRSYAGEQFSQLQLSFSSVLRRFGDFRKC